MSGETDKESRMKRMVIAAAALLAVGTTAALSQSAAIGQRKDVMKAVGAAAKDTGAMMRGEAPFDLAKVQAALKTYSDAANKAPGLFPDDSKTGGETTVVPAIWEKKAEFDGIFKKWDADSVAAAAAIKDEATFKTEWPKVMANCGTCHKAFRVPPKQ
jgi:cytochrome c556